MEKNFETEVDQQVERLRNNPYREIECQVAEKRVAWFKENQLGIEGLTSPSPRRVYELLFFDYMGLSAEDLPVASDTEKEIEWLSLNACPTLDACQGLGLDTREVCRGAYEKSTQALVSQLDPQLRFLRSYEEIRPHAAHCRERIVRVDFEGMMAMALEEAKVSKRDGNKGYGAVVAIGNEVIGRAHDTAITEKDPSLHAEVNAIRQAVHTIGYADLSGAVLFSTCEPCPMCSSLAVWSNLTTIVYGVSIQETVEVGRSRIQVSSQEIVERSPVMVEVIGGVLREECLSLYI